MEETFHHFGSMILDNTEHSVLISAILFMLIAHLVSSLIRGGRGLSSTNILGSNIISILRAGFSALLFVTGLRILGTVLTVDTCGRLSKEDFIIFGIVGTVACIVMGAIEIKTALLGKNKNQSLTSTTQGQTLQKPNEPT